METDLPMSSVEPSASDGREFHHCTAKAVARTTSAIRNHFDIRFLPSGRPAAMLHAMPRRVDGRGVSGAGAR
jgi:hypothetical protein